MAAFDAARAARPGSAHQARLFFLLYSLSLRAVRPPGSPLAFVRCFLCSRRCRRRGRVCARTAWALGPPVLSARARPTPCSTLTVSTPLSLPLLPTLKHDSLSGRHLGRLALLSSIPTSRLRLGRGLLASSPASRLLRPSEERPSFRRPRSVLPLDVSNAAHSRPVYVVHHPCSAALSVGDKLRYAAVRLAEALDSAHSDHSCNCCRRREFVESVQAEIEHVVSDWITQDWCDER